MNALADRGFLIYDMIKINDELKALIPPLTTKEYETLEQSIINEGCRDALIVWNDTLVDGHHRYSICQKHDLEFNVQDYEFKNWNSVKIWMIQNAKARRSLSDGWNFELSQTLKELLIEEGRLSKETHGKIARDKQLGVSSIIDTTPKKHDTRKEIANHLGWSTGKVAMADKVWKDAEQEVKDKIKSNEISFNQAYNDIKKQDKIKDREKSIAEIKEKGKTNKVESNIKLLEGDLFDKIKDIPDNSVDLLNTDPPYMVLENDWDQFKDKSDFLDFTERWLNAVMPKVKSKGRVYISFAPDYQMDFYALLQKNNYFNFNLGNIIIWVKKNNNKLFSQKKYRLTYEPIFYLYGNDAEKLNFDYTSFGETQTDVWEIATPQSNFSEGKYHSAQKPIELYNRIIKTGSKDGDLVLDCFAGSGTTGLVCKDIDRHCILIEKDQDNVNIIKGRL